MRPQPGFEPRTRAPQTPMLPFCASYALHYCGHGKSLYLNSIKININKNNTFTKKKIRCTPTKKKSKSAPRTKNL